MQKNKIAIYLAIIFCYTSCLSPSENKNNFNCKNKVDFNKEIETNYSNSLSKSIFIKLINRKESLNCDTLIYKNIQATYILVPWGDFILDSRIICLNDTSFFVIRDNPINDNRVRFQYNDNRGNLISKDSSFLIIDSSIFYENRVLNEVLHTLNSNNTSIDEVLNIIRIVKYSSILYVDEIDKRSEPILVQHSNLLHFIINSSFLEDYESLISYNMYNTYCNTFDTLFKYSSKFDNKNTIVFYNSPFKSFDIFNIGVNKADGKYFLSKQYTILPPCLLKRRSYYY